MLNLCFFVKIYIVLVKFMFKNEQVNRSPGASAIMNSVYILEDEFAH